MRGEEATGVEARLREALAEIERPLLREWSVKATPDGLQPGRWLVSLPRGALGPGPARTLRAILRALDAPPRGVELLDEVQAASGSVHFGVEPGPSGTLLKCYLEFDEARRPQADLVFLALKWRGDGRWALSSYLDRNGLSPSERRDLLRSAISDDAAFAAMRRLLEIAEGAGTNLLEVTEPASPRRSVDVNLSALRTSLADHEQTLAAFLGPGEEVLSYLRAHGDHALGHVAAGTGRDGQAFATLYHGAHRVHGPL